MKRTYGRDLGLSVRMAICMVALALLYLPFALWVVMLAYGFTASRAVAAIAAIALLVLLGLVPALSARTALMLAGARPVAAGELPDLRALVERLSAMADLPAPRIALAPTDVPNAFSAGRSPQRAVIVVTRGLLERLHGPELEAVIAHELAHVANRDAFVMTLASAPALLGRRLIWGVARLPFTARSLGGKLVAALFVLYLVPFLFLAWVVYALATLLVMSISRYREYAADRGAALLTGAPEDLMSALQSIAEALPLIPERDLREAAALNAFFVLPTDPGPGTFEIDPLRLFPTHPPLERRLARLSALTTRMGRLPGLQPDRVGDRVPGVPAAHRPGNPHAVGAFALALFVWAVVGGSWLLEPSSASDTLLWVPLAGSAALIGGVVLGFQGAARASAGAGGMGYAVTGLVLLLGPSMLAILVIFVFVLLGLLGIVPVG